MKIIVLRLPLAKVARTSVVPTSHGFGYTKSIFKTDFSKAVQANKTKQKALFTCLCIVVKKHTTSCKFPAFIGQVVHTTSPLVASPLCNFHGHESQTHSNLVKRRYRQARGASIIGGILCTHGAFVFLFCKTTFILQIDVMLL